MGSFLFMVIIVAVLGVLAITGYAVYYFAKKFMNNSQSTDASVHFSTKSIIDTTTLRFLVISILTVLMFIPLGLVEDIVIERNGNYQNVLNEIAGSWGREQTLTGPVLIIPFSERKVSEETITDQQGNQKTVQKVKEIHKQAVFLPEQLELSTQLQEEIRYRGIYESLVYGATVELTGEFAQPDLRLLSGDIAHINWEGVELLLGLSDTRAIQKVSKLQWNDQNYEFSPGTQQSQLMTTGFHALFPLDSNLPVHRFKLTIEIHGSTGWLFAPVGKVTHTKVTSSWPHPSFYGQLLPKHYHVSDQGFDAEWSIPHLARNYPQQWVLNPVTNEQPQNNANVYDLHEITAGVKLFEPVALYTKIIRAVKYGLLFIAMTFLTFLIFELTTQSSLHLIQYGLIGTALSLFYLTLLSLAEHVDFLYAYLLASCVIIGMITLYAASLMHSVHRAFFVFVLLSALYGVLYLLLQAEDYALLMGTGILILALAALMYVTRHLNRVSAT